MRVALLYNEVTEDPAYDPWLNEEPIFPVVEAIERLGHTVRRVSCTLDLTSVKSQLEQLNPDVVFNRVESLGGSDQMMAAATLLLEAMRLPYTGCTTSALLATTSKLATKQILRKSGLPTPAWFPPQQADRLLRREDLPELQPGASGGRPMMILKSICEHASFKMDDQSVVPFLDADSLCQLIRQREADWRSPFFAEQYIEGREFNISVLARREGPVILPCAEIDFVEFPQGKPRIVGYRAKWEADSFEYRHTPRRFDFPAADEPLLEQIRGLAKRCWHEFGLAGYARVDFRVDAQGQPWILEINANPSLAPDSGFAAAVERAGMTYDETIQQLLESALGTGAAP